MSRIPIILDVDTGIDDALAILLAATSERLEIRGITTLFGNRPLTDTTRNTLKICELLGLDVPVAAGAERALIVSKEEYEAFSGPHVHGGDGLGDVGNRLPAPRKALCGLSAVELMAQILRESALPVTLVPVGPLTNIAIFLLAYPELHKRIERIVLMGGAVFGGNAMPTAEANIYHDPEAAQIVFASGVPVTMCGLDATMQVYLTSADRARIAAIGNPVSDFYAAMLPCYVDFYEGQVGHSGCVLHDSVPVALLIDPDCVTTADYFVEVDLNGRYTRGCTVTDARRIPDCAPNVRAAIGACRETIVNMHITAFENYNKF